MRRLTLFIGLTSLCLNLDAQGSFSPQAGESGSDAIEATSSEFRDWAIDCEVERGWRQINLQDSGRATSGNANYAIGASDNPLTLSLGDSGLATLTFSAPIYDGEGWDFAVFENGFGAGSNAFLELAFVEVSSDGQNYLRFPAHSEMDTTVQIDNFETVDASYYHNLAGKYTAGYGVPFDLSDLPDSNVLDKDSITSVRLVDVVGSTHPDYGSRDSEGRIINDPFPTNFASGGFDLDAIGVRHSLIPLSVEDIRPTRKSITSNSFDLLGRSNATSEANTIHPNLLDLKLRSETVR